MRTRWAASINDCLHALFFCNFAPQGCISDIGLQPIAQSTSQMPATSESPTEPQTTAPSAGRNGPCSDNWEETLTAPGNTRHMQTRQVMSRSHSREVNCAGDAVCSCNAGTEWNGGFARYATRLRAETSGPQWLVCFDTSFWCCVSMSKAPA